MRFLASISFSNYVFMTKNALEDKSELKNRPQNVMIFPRFLVCRELPLIKIYQNRQQVSAYSIRGSPMLIPFETYRESKYMSLREHGAVSSSVYA